MLLQSFIVINCLFNYFLINFPFKNLKVYTFKLLVFIRIIMQKMQTMHVYHKKHLFYDVKKIGQPNRKIEKVVLLSIKQEDEEAIAERISSLNIDEKQRRLLHRRKRK